MAMTLITRIDLRQTSYSALGNCAHTDYALRGNILKVYGGSTNAELLHLLGGIEGAILDIGPGAGSWGGNLNSDGATKLIGTEPAPELAAKAFEHYDEVRVARLRMPRLSRSERPAYHRSGRLGHDIDLWLSSTSEENKDVLVPG